MTDEQLAEFGIDFCGFELVREEVEGGIIDVLEWPEPYSGLIPPLVPSKIGGSFLDDLILAPILMHLAEMELTKMEFTWCSDTYISSEGVRFYSTEIFKNAFLIIDESEAFNENKFRAFWTAVYMVVKGGSDG